jgi:TPR repeat protein
MNEAIQHEPSTAVVVTSVSTDLTPTHYSLAPEYNEMVLSLLRQSARGGNAESMAKLGAMHACGDGVPRITALR